MVGELAGSEGSEKPLSFIGQNSVTRLARFAFMDRDHASTGVEIGGAQPGKPRITTASQQCTANEIAERRFAGIDETCAFGLGQIAHARGLHRLEWFHAAPRVITYDVSAFPGMVERRFENGHDAVCRGAATPNAVGTGRTALIASRTSDRASPQLDYMPHRRTNHTFTK
jgi:hypothetical protein